MESDGRRCETGREPESGILWGPDGVRIEYYADTAIPVPVKMDHTHSFVPDINATKDWYMKALGGVPGQRPRVSGPGWNEVVHFPGMTVTFAGVQGGATLAPTKGRSLDQIGLEVKDLDAYVEDSSRSASMSMRRRDKSPAPASRARK